jgi:hypothetical protein
MQAVKTNRLNKIYLAAIVLIALIGIGLYLTKAVQAASLAQTSAASSSISQQELETQYGLRINLVAVTAAGGLVDVRLKIVDGEKAKSLLQTPGNFPILWIADTNVSLVVPEENRAQEIKFEDGGNLFLMFPNAGGAVKPGTPVVIRFGDTQLEAIPAR